MTRFERFIRKWGRAAPLDILPDGSVRLAHRGDDTLLRLMADELAEAGEPVVRTARSYRFTKQLKLDPSKIRNWNVDENDILSATTIGGKPLEKFSWNPKTGEFLLVWPGQNHASASGSAPFDDYVRGIILPGRKVTFRPFWPTWLRRGPYDTFDEEASMVSWDAQYAAREMIEAHSKGGQSYRVNVTNKQLEEMTGRTRW